MKICIDINDTIRGYTNSFIKRFKKAYPVFGTTYYVKSEDGWWETSEAETDNVVTKYDELPKNAEVGDCYKVTNEEFDVDEIEITSLDYENVFPFPNRQEYEKFVYEDYPYEIFGCADSVSKELPVKFLEWQTRTLTNIDTDEPIEIMFASTMEFQLTLTSTYFFLAKDYRVREMYMPTDSATIWDKCDVLITANPKLLLNKPDGKTSIKINTTYNTELEADYEYDSMVEFMEDKNNVEKLLK
jgi:hypothetical protein